MEKKRIQIQLWIVRHGQTEDNISATLAGHQPGKLTALGVDQAKQTGRYLKDEHFDYAYCSDLGRTKHTYQNIAEQTLYIKKLHPVFTPLLREKGGGVLEGGPLKTWRENAQKEGKNIRQYKCEGGESWEDVNNRARDFLHLLIKNHLSNQGIAKHTQKSTVVTTSTASKKTDYAKNSAIKVLAISHGGYIMEFHNLVKLLAKGIPPVFNNVAKNCSIHIFRISYNGDVEAGLDDSQIKVECTKQNFSSHIK